MQGRIYRDFCDVTGHAVDPSRLSPNASRVPADVLDSPANGRQSVDVVGQCPLGLLYYVRLFN